MKKLPTIEQVFNSGRNLGYQDKEEEEHYFDDKLPYKDFESFVEWFEEAFQSIPFDLELYNTGKYDLQTRSGDKVIFIGINTLLDINKGNFVFASRDGILSSKNSVGTWSQSKEDKEDIIMILK